MRKQEEVRLEELAAEKIHHEAIEAQRAIVSDSPFRSHYPLALVILQDVVLTELYNAYLEICLGIYMFEVGQMVVFFYVFLKLNAIVLIVLKC